jgi:hypothetical protein
MWENLEAFGYTLRSNVIAEVALARLLAACAPTVELRSPGVARSAQNPPRLFSSGAARRPSRLSRVLIVLRTLKVSCRLLVNEAFWMVRQPRIQMNTRRGRSGCSRGALFRDQPEWLSPPRYLDRVSASCAIRPCGRGPCSAPLDIASCVGRRLLLERGRARLTWSPTTQ